MVPVLKKTAQPKSTIKANIHSYQQSESTTWATRFNSANGEKVGAVLPRLVERCQLWIIRSRANKALISALKILR